MSGLVVDATTKAIAVSYLDPSRPIRLLGGLLTLQLTRNSGAAFSLGLGLTPVFTVLAVIVLAIVIGLSRRLGHRGWAVALGLLVAGIAGNLVDRLIRPPGIARGHVVDFFQLPHFAIFNVADMCITSAVVLILTLSMIKNVAVDGTRYPRPERRPRTSGGGE